MASIIELISETLDNHPLSQDDNEEYVIRAEARDVWKEDLYTCLSMFDLNLRREFRQKLQHELSELYSQKHKALFLDEILNVLKMTEEKGKIAFRDFTGANYLVDVNLEQIRRIRFFVQQEMNKLPTIVKLSDQATQRSKVFVSYSRIDVDVLNSMKRHFKPLTEKIDFWDDSRIMPGEKWKEEIEAAMADVKVALLLVSIDFFNSEFITSNELPRLLKSSEEEGATILIIIVKPIAFELFELSRYQTLNKPEYPISTMDETERENLWVNVVREVLKVISPSSNATIT